MTPDERAERLLDDIMSHLGLDVLVGKVRSEPVVTRIVAAIREALADRDMEWWQALALVDNVAPTPEAVKEWLLRLAAHEQKEAAAAMKERCVNVANTMAAGASDAGTEESRRGGAFGRRIAAAIG